MYVYSRTVFTAALAAVLMTACAKQEASAPQTATQGTGTQAGAATANASPGTGAIASTSTAAGTTTDFGAAPPQPGQSSGQ